MKSTGTENAVPTATANTTFNIQINWPKFFQTFPTPPTENNGLIDLSDYVSTGVLTVENKGKFQVPAGQTSADVLLTFTGVDPWPTENPQIYLAKLGSINFRYGNLDLITSVSDNASPVPHKAGIRFGAGIKWTFEINPSAQPNDSVDFRIHFAIGVTLSTGPVNYMCFIDPQMQVSGQGSI